MTLALPNIWIPRRRPLWQRFTEWFANGDKLLDADGNRYLESDGDQHLSDAAGDDCCCGCDPCLLTPTITAVALAGLTSCTSCTGPNTNGSNRYGKITAGDPNGTYTPTWNASCETLWSTTGPTVATYNDSGCSSLFNSSNPVTFSFVTDITGATEIQVVGTYWSFFYWYGSRLDWGCTGTVELDNQYTACNQYPGAGSRQSIAYGGTMTLTMTFPP